MCARGTTGQLPYCLPCGECFDNWDAILMGLKSEYDRMDFTSLATENWKV